MDLPGLCVRCQPFFPGGAQMGVSGWPMELPRSRLAAEPKQRESAPLMMHWMQGEIVHRVTRCPQRSRGPAHPQARGGASLPRVGALGVRGAAVEPRWRPTLIVGRGLGGGERARRRRAGIRYFRTVSPRASRNLKMQDDADRASGIGVAPALLDASQAQQSHCRGAGPQRADRLHRFRVVDGGRQREIGHKATEGHKA